MTHALTPRPGLYFIHPNYVRQKKLPVKLLPNPCKIVNVDGTPNTAGEIKHYTDLEMTLCKA